VATYQSNPGANRLVARALRAGVSAAGVSYRKELRTVVGKKGRKNTSSAPGHPPQKDKGGYQHSIRLARPKAGEHHPVATVFADGKLPRKLEFGTSTQAPRPHWIPTFNRLRDFMLKRVADTFRYTMLRALNKP